MRFLRVNILDFDGDRMAEIQANHFVFSGMPEPGWSWAQRARILLPSHLFMAYGNTGIVFDRNSARLVVNDVDGDGRDDIVSYRAGDDFIRIHAWRQESDAQDEPLAPEVRLIGRIPVEVVDPDLVIREGQNMNPILVALDGDGRNEGDVQTLQFLRHEFGFTEPLVLAAIAAPPCVRNIGQNTDACTSSWGNATTSGIDAAKDISFHAGIIAGFETEWQAGAGFVASATTKVFGLAVRGMYSEEYGLHRSESFEVSKSVSFETGPMEDSVVFVSTPYDFYVYEAIASTLVTMDDYGATLEVHRLGLPRTPIIRMAETGYYNAHTTAGSLKIDSSVFEHVVGRIDSYPSRARRDEILALRKTQLDDIRLDCPGCWKLDPDGPVRAGESPLRQFDRAIALEGLVTELVGVGQGGGATEVALDFSRDASDGESLEWSAEVEIEVNISGIFVGAAFGGGVSQSTTISRGESTSYVGTAGGIDAEHFADHQYRFGMFTYLQGDPGSGQEFEVINYWVE